MKTPEEIKRGLEYCSEEHESCKGCTYFDDEDYEMKCLDAVMADALDYINQLEQRLAQVERERDVLMWDARGCHSCKHIKNKIDEPPCDECTEEGSGWEWRGVCEENSR